LFSFLFIPQKPFPRLWGISDNQRHVFYNGNPILLLFFITCCKDRTILQLLQIVRGPAKIA
jgi:hypothetical protein